MKDNQALFRLIKSLSKSEKRHFFLFASSLNNKEKNYLNLFYAIEKQEHYDENALKNRFKGESFVKFLASTKKYLYELILKSLDKFHGTAKVEERVMQLLRFAQLLSYKGITDQAEQKLMQAKKLCYEYERYQLLLFVMNQQSHIIRAKGNQWINMKQLILENEEIVKRITTINHLNMFVVELVLNAAKLKQKNYQQEREKTLLEFEKTLSSSFEKSGYYLACSAYYSLCGNQQEAHEFTKKNILLLEKNPNLILADPNYHFHLFYAFIEVSLEFKRVSEIFPSLKKTKALYKKYPVLKKSVPEDVVEGQIAYWELLAYSITYQFHAITDTLQHQVENLLNVRQDQNYKPIVIATARYRLAIVYFVKENFKQALHQLNTVLEDKKTAHKSKHYVDILLLRLLICYELKHFDLLESYIRSTNRYLISIPVNHDYEDTIIRLMKQLEETEKEETIKLCKATKEELTKIKNPERERDSIELWIESKITTTSVKITAKEKSKLFTKIN